MSGPGGHNITSILRHVILRNPSHAKIIDGTCSHSINHAILKQTLESDRTAEQV